jgi:hypothetical protein
MSTTTLAPAPATPDEPGRGERDTVFAARMLAVDTSRHDVRFREGMLAAYRELGRLDLVPALVQDMEWLDRFSPDEPPSLNRYAALGSVRRAPDGTLLDLVRPVTDQAGEVWHWCGFTTHGEPLITLFPGSGYYAPISEIYSQAGPFTQDPAVALPAGPCSLCGTDVQTALHRDPTTGELTALCAWCRPQSHETGTEAGA